MGVQLQIGPYRISVAKQLVKVILKILDLAFEIELHPFLRVEGLRLLLVMHNRRLDEAMRMLLHVADETGVTLIVIKLWVV